jgi:2TM domain
MRYDPALRGFLIHLAAYVVVVAGLAVLNLIRNPDHIWFVWVLAGWGVGLAAHDLALLLHRRRGPSANLTAGARGARTKP